MLKSSNERFYVKEKDYCYEDIIILKRSYFLLDNLFLPSFLNTVFMASQIGLEVTVCIIQD